MRGSHAVLRATLTSCDVRRSSRSQAWSLQGGGRYVSYDDPRAVRAKARFARAQGLAGLFAWELSQDNGEILDAMQP